MAKFPSIAYNGATLVCENSCMPDLKPLIGYIVDQVQEQGGSLGMTALIKLVYLVDLEHYRTYGRRATEIDWIFHHYGPYDSALESEIKDNGFVQVHGDRQTGYGFSRPHDRQGLHRSFDDEYGNSGRLISNRVVEQWGLESLNALLDYVYFQTEPMQDVERGDSLDFSTAPIIGATSDRPIEVRLPDERLKELRALWDKREEERTRKPPRKPLNVPYDEITEEAYRVMAEDERPYRALPFKIRLNVSDSGDES